MFFVGCKVWDIGDVRVNIFEDWLEYAECFKADVGKDLVSHPRFLVSVVVVHSGVDVAELFYVDYRPIVVVGLRGSVNKRELEE